MYYERVFKDAHKTFDKPSCMKVLITVRQCKGLWWLIIQILLLKILGLAAQYLSAEMQTRGPTYAQRTRQFICPWKFKKPCFRSSGEEAINHPALTPKEHSVVEGKPNITLLSTLIVMSISNRSNNILIIFHQYTRFHWCQFSLCPQKKIWRKFTYLNPDEDLVCNTRAMQVY